MTVFDDEKSANPSGAKERSMHAAHDRMALSIPSNPQYLCAVRAFLSSLLNDLEFDSKEVEGVVLAVHEACTNVIEHCYQGDLTQRIDFTVIVEPEWITIEVQDYGQKQDVSTIEPRSLHDVRPRGLGTHFIRSIMDEVTYNSSNTGTLVRMAKRRSVPCKST
jgi:anti-sigma regulatory factor (Ser/Thr protein kinase)